MATFSGILYSRIKSLATKILCCISSSLINKIKSSVKVPRGPGTWYINTNNKVSYSISSTTGNNSKTLQMSIIIIPKVVKEKLHLEKLCNLVGQCFFFLSIIKQLNLFQDITFTDIHRTMTRIILEKFISRKSNDKVSWKCKKAHMWCVLQFGTICPITK